MKVIVYRNPTFQCAVLIPVRHEGETDDEAFERAKGDLPPDTFETLEMEYADLPKDRSNRNQWRLVNGKIENVPSVNPSVEDIGMTGTVSDFMGD